MTLHDYERLLAPARERFAVSPGVRAIQSSHDAAFLESFLLHFSALGSRMTARWLFQRAARLLASAILHLIAGTTVTPHIVNDSNGGHNFSAPELCAASSFPAAHHPLTAKSKLTPNRVGDIVFIPLMPGTYKIECRHFLYSLFGEPGSVVVEAPAR